MNDQFPASDALDQALSRALKAPPLPDGFRTRLRAAMARSGEVDVATRRRLIEQERREQLQLLQSDSVRLRRQTLVTLLGGAFATGVAVTVALPWIRSTFGTHSNLALLSIATGAGLLIAAAGWARHSGAPRWLP